MSYRISVQERDRSGFISASTDETGAMILYSMKGRKDKPILCQTEDDVITQVGYPSATYPSVFEALAFVRKAPLYIVCPFGTDSLWGGIDVTATTATGFGQGRVDPDNFDYTAVNASGSLSLGTADGVETNFTGTASPIPVEEGSTEIYSDSTQLSITDSEGSFSGDDVSTGTITYATGVTDITLATAPTSGSLIRMDYTYNVDLSSSVSHSFFTASPYTDELSADIEWTEGTKFKMTLYKKVGTVYTSISGYESLEYSLTREKDGFGASIYIEDVFKDDPYLIPKINSDFSGSYSVDVTKADFSGGSRTTPLASDYSTAWNLFRKAKKYPARIFMDAIGNSANTINTLITTYQPYAHGLTILDYGNSVAEHVVERQGYSIDSDNISFYCNWSRIEDSYNNSEAWISNIGSVGKKFAMMADLYDSGSPAGIDEDEHGGQLNDWRYLEVEEDFSDSEQQTLDEAQINPVIFDDSYGVMIYGDKTGQVSLSDTSFIGHRRAFNYLLDKVIKHVLRKQVFKNNDEDHRNRARILVDEFIASTLGAVGAFREWFVLCDATNNTDQILAQRRFILDIYIKVTPNSQFVQCRLTHVGQSTVIAELLP